MDTSDLDDYSLGDGEWYTEMILSIDEVRALYEHVSYAVETWPGSPRRPTHEQELLMIMKMRFFAMLQDYNFYNN